jgi:nucleotide-binding universal stress UspA family protein
MAAKLRKEAEEEMERFLAPAREVRLDYEVELVEGDPAREIQAAAEEWPAHLVVMGTHGRGGLERLVLGSVTEKLMRRLPCSVLSVCHEEGRTWEAPGLVRRILCPTDFSEAAALATNHALSLAERLGADLTLLHVIEGVPVPGEPLYRVVPEAEPLRQALEERARAQLRAAAPPDLGPRLRLRERLVVGRAYSEILRAAAEERPDLIVMGAQGDGPLGHMLFGANAHHVVREATCPVLTVRPLRPRPRSEVPGRLAMARA